MTKPCSTCKKVLPKEFFSPDKKNKSGLRSCCKPCSREMHKRWLALNPLKMASAKKSWNKRNPDKACEYRRRTRAKHNESMCARDRAYRANNKLLIKAVNCNSKAQQRLKKKILVDSMALASLMHSADGYCSYCGKNESKLTFDHATPIVRGGEHALENIEIVCVTCNSRKGGMTMPEFKEYCALKGHSLVI